MPGDPNLTAALQASLEFTGEDSPLLEADPNAIEELLDRVNQNLIQGAPQEISDSDLRKLVLIYRAQALKWAQDEEIKASKPKRGTNGGTRKSIGEILNLDI